MRDIYFHYSVFDKSISSRIQDINKDWKESEDKKFKARLLFSGKGEEVFAKPELIWNESLRPPVGFSMKTIEIALTDWIPEGKGYKIFQHGYQSWSLSTSYSANEKDISPRLEFLRYSQENVYSLHSGRQGDFLSEGFVMLYSPEAERGILLGIAKLSEPGVRFHCLLDSEGRVEKISAIFDYHFKPDWKGKSRISTPDIVCLNFRANPEKVMESYFKKFATFTGIPKPEGKPPTGWCSWYYFYTDISEKGVLENLREVKKRKLPIQFFQIDDGYQKTIGDWLVTNEKFPAGMRVIAEEIRREGLEPGIWLAPFLVRKESEFFQKYPEAVLKNEKGKPVPALWNPLWGKDYTYCIDLTHPVSIEFLTKIFKTITKDWGYQYLKLDFLYAGLLPGEVFNPNFTPQTRYQNALKLIRKTVGKEVFLLGCGAPIFPSIGHFQGMRISCDVAPFWKPEWKRRLLKDKHAFCTEKALINDITRSGMHRHFWFNDPDCLLVRKRKNKMSYRQTLIMASVLALSGGMLLVSDDLRKLESHRYELLQKTLQLSAKCMNRTPIPIGIFQSPFPPALYNPSGFLGVWNPFPKTRILQIPLPFLPKNSVWKDYWTEAIHESARVKDGCLILELEGFDSKVFFV